ncbi:hypothetical protein MKW92_011369, partial [Papaver armeniacum]
DERREGFIIRRRESSFLLSPYFWIRNLSYQEIEEEKRRNKLRDGRGAEEDCKIVAEQDSNSSKV